MTLLSPIWLAALAALALPILLHLLSHGARRRVKIGSVRLLRDARRHQARRIRPTQVLLLLVRCLLLAVLAWVLAEPRIWREAKARPESTWVLASPRLGAERNSLETENAALFSALDAELAEASVSRWLMAGLPPLDLPPRNSSPRNSSPPDAEPALDMWSLLREADAEAPRGARFVIFADDRLDALRGQRPILERPVEWHALSTPGQWIAQAPPAASSGSSWTAILYHHPERTEDAALVAAALHAATDVLGTELRLELRELDGSTEPERDIDPATDLLVWLSPQPVPEPLAATRVDGGLLLSDGGERFAPVSVRLSPPGLVAGSFLLHRHSLQPNRKQAVVLWRDDAGRPWLEASRIGVGWRYLFHGRLHPQWGEFVLSPAFPEWIRTLLTEHLLAHNEADSWVDHRAADGQGIPETAAVPSTGRQRTSRGLESWLWLLVALLFGVERWMARGSKLTA